MIKKLEDLRRQIDKSLSLFRFREAQRLAQKGLNIAKKEKLPFFEYYFKAQVLIIEQEYKKAIFYLNLALKERPQDSFSLNDKGICLAESGKLREALTYFDKAIKSFPGYGGFYQNKGWALTLKKDYKKALGYFYKALEFEPEACESLFSIGFCFENLSEPKKAKIYYLRALKSVKGRSRLAQIKITQALKRL